MSPILPRSRPSTEPGAVHQQQREQSTGKGERREAAARHDRAGQRTTAGAAERLTNAWRLWSALQQVLRICLSGELKAEAAPAPLLARIAAIAGCRIDELEVVVRATQSAVRADFLQIVGQAGDGTPPASRSSQN